MKRKAIWLLLLLGSGAGVFALGRFSVPTPAEPLPPLPPEVIEVEVVKEIEVPGPERVVERIVWKTLPAEIPDPILQTVTKWLAPDCPVPVEAPQTPLQARVQVDADKYEGTTPDGRVAFGWRGEAACFMSRGAEEVKLAHELFDLSSSRAITTIAPSIPRRTWTVDARLGVHSDQGVDLGVSFHKKSRLGYYLGYQTGRYDESFLISDFFGENEPLSFSESFSASRVSGGLSFRFGRRYP